MALYSKWRNLTSEYTTSSPTSPPSEKAHSPPTSPHSEKALSPATSPLSEKASSPPAPPHSEKALSPATSPLEKASSPPAPPPLETENQAVVTLADGQVANNKASDFARHSRGLYFLIFTREQICAGGGDCTKTS